MSLSVENVVRARLPNLVQILRGKWRSSPLSPWSKNHEFHICKVESISTRFQHNDIVNNQLLVVHSGRIGLLLAIKVSEASMIVIGWCKDARILINSVWQLQEFWQVSICLDGNKIGGFSGLETTKQVGCIVKVKDGFKGWFANIWLLLFWGVTPCSELNRWVELSSLNFPLYEPLVLERSSYNGKFRLVGSYESTELGITSGSDWTWGSMDLARVWTFHCMNFCECLEVHTMESSDSVVAQ